MIPITAECMIRDGLYALLSMKGTPSGMITNPLLAVIQDHWHGFEVATPGYRRELFREGIDQLASARRLGRLARYFIGNRERSGRGKCQAQ